MNYRQIEGLKYIISNMVKKGCWVSIPAYGIEGRLVGAGYRPFWTNLYDSKIDKLELNIMDDRGRIVPFNFHYVIGFDIVHKDNWRFDKCNEISLDISVYPNDRTGGEVTEQKVHVDMSTIQKK